MSRDKYEEMNEVTARAIAESFQPATTQIITGTKVPVRASGGLNNYYLVEVNHPQRPEQPPYVAECEDITHALGLTPEEFNIFKELWRSARQRQGNGKPGHDPLYGAEKVAHYATRRLNLMKQES